MEKALNLRLFATLCDHPPLRSGYVSRVKRKAPGSNPAKTFFFPFFLFFFFFVLSCLLICFAGFFFVLFLNMHLNNCY